MTSRRSSRRRSKRSSRRKRRRSRRSRSRRKSRRRNPIPPEEDFPEQATPPDDDDLPPYVEPDSDDEDLPMPPSNARSSRRRSRRRSRRKSRRSSKRSSRRSRKSRRRRSRKRSRRRTRRRSRRRTRRRSRRRSRRRGTKSSPGRSRKSKRLYGSDLTTNYGNLGGFGDSLSPVEIGSPVFASRDAFDYGPGGGGAVIFLRPGNAVVQAQAKSLANDAKKLGQMKDGDKKGSAAWTMAKKALKFGGSLALYPIFKAYGPSIIEYFQLQTLMGDDILNNLSTVGINTLAEQIGVAPDGQMFVEFAIYFFTEIHLGGKGRMDPRKLEGIRTELRRQHIDQKSNQPIRQIVAEVKRIKGGRSWTGATYQARAVASDAWKDVVGYFTAAKENAGKVATIGKDFVTNVTESLVSSALGSASRMLPGM